ncbi:MAG: PEP-CTERM sorting domain-containing protein [Luteolibacter sp.]|uniref:PEP-CTERM sorting domain-containing protein n=1 Tax=Luteolibacter sp. TaxID=1962973 RepID=UPI0032641AA1
MKKWTTQAEQRLVEYLQERAVREGFEGEEAAELKDDLRRHVHEEAEQTTGDSVGLMHLENILGKLDAGYQPMPPAGPPPQMKGGFLRWTCGVVLPVAVLLLELFTSFCGAVFFSPIPTWWHAVLVATVPLVNAWLLCGGRGTGEKTRGAAAGFALVTAVFYAVLFLPLLPLSLIALIAYGLGLLSLTPILAAFVSWRIGGSARRESLQPARFKTGWRLGALAAVAVLVILEAPAVWTRVNLSEATGDSAGAAPAIERLRTFSSEKTLLRACYEGNRGMAMGTDISGWVFKGCDLFLVFFCVDQPEAISSERARDVFFRVTGKPFNSLEPPSSVRGNSIVGRGDSFEDFEIDEHRGGDEVAVRLKKLDLAESRFDGHVDGVSRIGYGEWTMVFRNGSGAQKEARCQVKLPRDGRVSRLTLWVNGEPREAAFSTVSKVKAAYKSVAIVQRRDPVMVNMVGPDTVMVQCFPVPAHGEMKIRFGVTAPLDGTRWELPHIVERNFGTLSGLEHAIWMQGDPAFQLTNTEKSVSSTADGEGQSLSATLGESGLMNPGVALNISALPAEPPVVWCEDKFAKAEERFLIRETATITRPAAGKTVIVIDGSLSMAVTKDWLVKAIGSQKPDQIQLILADDHARLITLNEVKSYRFTGGRNNEPALREGIRMARENSGPVVWIHGPQAVGLAQTEALIQLLERGTVKPDIHDIEAVAGPNRLAEAIYQTGCLHRGPSLVSPGQDFSRFLNGLQTERQEISWNWKRAATSENLAGVKVWDQLARSWAATTAEDAKSGLTDTARSELAARYQMITPFSGAVVLETQRQYAENGLTPGDPSASPGIPNVPEPSTGLLVILTTAAALMRRRRTE